MVGYVRPLRGELKVRQYEYFRAVYCGLCHTLSERYGPFARHMLSYDATFLALALSGADKGADYARLRCPASPLRKRCVVRRCRPLEAAADICVIFFWRKLCDQVADGKLPQKILYGALRFLSRPYYRRAAGYLPGFEEAVGDGLAALSRLEKERPASLDAPADAFARCVGAAAAAAGPDAAIRRPIEQMFYHVGRWVYIMDAYDDVREDIRNGAYNPVVYRFGLKDADIPSSVGSQVALTAGHSLNLARDAFQLVDFGDAGEVISNILYLGMPYVQKKVLEGTWHKGDKHERSL